MKTAIHGMKKISITFLMALCIFCQPHFASSSETQDDHKIVSWNGIDIHIQNNMEYIHESGTGCLILRYKNHNPPGIISLDQGAPLELEEFIRRSNDTGYEIDKTELLQCDGHDTVYSMLHVTNKRLVIYDYFILDQGILIQYTGPPENYKFFEATQKSALPGGMCKQHTKSKVSERNIKP